MTEEHPAEGRNTDAEVTAIVAGLEGAGLLVVGRDGDGNETWTLTNAGARISRQMAMSRDGLLSVLLDAADC